MNEHHQQSADDQTSDADVTLRRPRRDASQWRALVEQHRESGLSVRAFCQQHALNEVTFYAWRRRLREQDSPASDAPARFVRLQPRGPGEDDHIQVQFVCGATLRCPATRLPELVRLLKGDDGGSTPC